MQGKELMATGNNYTHLGLESEVGKKPNMEQNVDSARKVSYALLGVGLQGHNGLKRWMSMMINWKTWIHVQYICTMLTIMYNFLNIKFHFCFISK